MNKKKSILNLSVTKNEDMATIDVDDYIGDDWSDSVVTDKKLKSQLAELKQLYPNIKKIRVNVATYGGDVKHGLVMYDTLKEFDGEVTTVIQGLTASAGTIISQAASPGRRLQSDNSTQLIHPAWTFTWGNATDLRAEADDLDRITDRIINIYVKNGANEAKVLETFAERDKWLLPDEALEMGLIDSIHYPEEKENSSIDTRAVSNFKADLAKQMPFNMPKLIEAKNSKGEKLYFLPSQSDIVEFSATTEVNETEKSEELITNFSNNNGQEQPHNLERIHAHAIARSRKYKSNEV